MYVSV
ncbi:hypothetical protein ECEC4422_1337, partial [Escherichia coli EC4422]